MYLKKDRLTLRNATTSDAMQLCLWWNDGRIMAHAGFPDGLHTTVERIKAQLAGDTDQHRRLIIEKDNKPIGEMSYRAVQDGAAEIGIKLCDEREQNKGYGSILLRMLISSLFTEYGFSSIVLDTNHNNLRAQHVYEKLGFRKLRINQNAFTDQHGVPQASVDYVLTPEAFTL